MKKYSIFCLAFLHFLPILVSAQFSAGANFFLSDLQKIAAQALKSDENLPQDLIQKYDLYKKDGEYFVGALLLTDNDFSKKELIDWGVKIQTDLGQLLSVRVPINTIGDLKNINGIKYIEIGEEVTPDLSRSHFDTRVDTVHLGGADLLKAYKGKGVIIGIIDWGFDYTHPVFYDSVDVGLRLVRAWDQNKLSGPPPAGFDFGTAYESQATLEAAGSDTLYLFGPSSHGTHVAGIAGGNGASTPNIGVAPESELIFISLKRDAPSLIDGINYISQYAAEVGKPFVVNMSFGSHLGPHDGTDLKNQGIDLMAGPGKIFVGSAGNNGRNNFHLEKDFAQTPGDTLLTVVNFINPNDDAYGGVFGQTLTMWGSENSSFSVALRITAFNDSTLYQTPFYNTLDNPFITDTTIFIPGTQDSIVYRMSGDAKSPLNDKSHIRWEVRKPNGLKAVLMVTSNDANVHLWNHARLNLRTSNWGYNFSANYPNAVGGNSEYGLGEPAGVGKSVLTVASHEKEVLIPVNGNIVGGLQSDFTSSGPTVDGRYKPDISAPGSSITSSVNSFDNSQGILTNPIERNGRTYGFRSSSGTSMSGPTVAGIVALMLEANPNLTAAQIKDIIINTARLDGNTGPIPPQGDLRWGHGKVNAFNALKMVEQISSTDAIASANNTLEIYPNPTNEALYIRSKSEIAAIFIYNLQGKIVQSLNATFNQGDLVQINVNNLSSGLYIIECKSEKGIYRNKFIKK